VVEHTPQQPNGETVAASAPVAERAPSSSGEAAGGTERPQRTMTETEEAWLQRERKRLGLNPKTGLPE
jgi:hypothetical protein